MLIEAEKVDIRRWLGYPIINPGYPDAVFSEVYDNNLFPVSLTEKLDALSIEEEEVLRVKYLEPLNQLEDDIPNSRDNLDTLEAGPWKANPSEVAARSDLFNKLRRAMAGYLGFKPGPGLGGRLTFERS